MRSIIRSLLYTFACAGVVSLLAGARENTALADTTASGYISADTTWTAANSPYSVTGNVIVRSGVTLTIEPGVTVKFDADKALQIDGGLIAKGTSASPITFTGGKDASTGTTAKWAYILFSDSSTDATYSTSSGDYASGSIMEYCTVEYAGGTSVSDNGAIRMNNAHPFINYCTIRNNSAPGIYAYNIAGTLKITNSTITDNKGTGVSFSHSGGATTISGNTIKNNTASSGGGIFTSWGTVTLTNNTISSNTSSSYGGGIYAASVVSHK
ncbi:MAG: right-handed parallel beta-helix repeat-containing protein [Ignavibacteriales bacterium]|nr:right-handed parallel beta-helix repeat-containing protein [Ignavibacteriales bacterium]